MSFDVLAFKMGAQEVETGHLLLAAVRQLASIHRPVGCDARLLPCLSSASPAAHTQRSLR